MEQEKVWVVDSFRVCVIDGQIVALMEENGHDTIYEVKRASKQFKDMLFAPTEVSKIN